MGTYVTKTFYLTVGGVDLTDHAESVEVDDNFDEVDMTNLGSGGNRERLGGLGDGSVTILWQADYAASKVDATLWANRGALASVVFRPTSAVVGTGNPQYTASYLISKLKPVSGKVGDKAGFTLTWPRSGALTRATS